MSCHSTPKKSQAKSGITFALAGNANVGKSVLFNQLTGSSQIIGNWPGKTVEKAEGTLTFEGQKMTVIDLPGIYSFSTFGMEELVSREFIALENPDVVINVVDASVLERNLFFTLQLIEMGAEVAKNRKRNGKPFVRYGAEIEERICKLDQAIQAENLGLPYPSRWIAIKLLENDLEIKKLVSSKTESIIKLSEALAAEISSIHNEPSFAVVAAERYSLANKIAGEAQRQGED